MEGTYVEPRNHPTDELLQRLFCLWLGHVVVKLDAVAQREGRLVGREVVFCLGIGCPRGEGEGGICILKSTVEMVNMDSSSPAPKPSFFLI